MKRYSIKTLKLLISVLMIFLCLFTFLNSVYGYNWKSTIEKVDTLDDTYKDDYKNVNSSAKKIVGAAISAMRIIATGVALIMIMLVALKYMTAAPSEKADIKKHAIPFVVGAIILFASTGILSIIQKFAATI